MPPKTPKKIATRTLSRRSLIDWMGKATVLALGGEALAACAAGDGGSSDAGFPDGNSPDGGLDGGVDSGFDAESPDGSGLDADVEGEPSDADGVDADEGGFGDGDIDGDTAGEGEWDFAPPTERPEIYEDWPSRTVDRQNIAEILASWELRIDGMVDTPVTLTFAQLLELTRQDQITDFHCVEGWSVYDVPWNGVHLSTLLDLVGVQSDATHVTYHTINGQYNESLPLDVALEPRTLLAYGVDDHTLPLSHGFPLRLHVPRLLAYKSAKYIQRIELTDEPVAGFWVALGYDYLGEVPEGRLREGRY